MDNTVHGILQARILECVAFPFSRGSSPTQESNPGFPFCRWILYQLSPGWLVNKGNLCTQRDTTVVSTPRKHHVKTWQGGNCWEVREGGLERNHPCQHLYFGLPASRTVNFRLSHTSCDISSYHYQTNILLYTTNVTSSNVYNLGFSYMPRNNSVSSVPHWLISLSSPSLLYSFQNGPLLASICDRLIYQYILLLSRGSFWSSG